MFIPPVLYVCYGMALSVGGSVVKGTCAPYTLDGTQAETMLAIEHTHRRYMVQAEVQNLTIFFFFLILFSFYYSDFPATIL